MVIDRWTIPFYPAPEKIQYAIATVWSAGSGGRKSIWKRSQVHEISHWL